jgi:hypothetical protein
MTYWEGFVIGFFTFPVLLMVLSLLASSGLKRFPPVVQRKPKPSPYQKEDY